LIWRREGARAGPVKQVNDLRLVNWSTTRGDPQKCKITDDALEGVGRAASVVAGVDGGNCTTRTTYWDFMVTIAMESLLGILE